MKANLRRSPDQKSLDARRVYDLLVEMQTAVSDPRTAGYEFARVGLAERVVGDAPHRYDPAMLDAYADHLHNMSGDLNQLCFLPGAATESVDIDASVARLGNITAGVDSRTAKRAALAAHPDGLTGAALLVKLTMMRYVARVDGRTPLEWARFVASRVHVAGKRLDDYELSQFFVWMGRELRVLVNEVAGGDWTVPLGVLDFDGVIDRRYRDPRPFRGGEDVEEVAADAVLDLRRDRDTAQAFAALIVSRLKPPTKREKGGLDLMRAWRLLDAYAKTGDPAVFESMDDYTGKRQTIAAQKKARQRLLVAARELARRALETGEAPEQA